MFIQFMTFIVLSVSEQGTTHKQIRQPSPLINGNVLKLMIIAANELYCNA